MNIPTPEFSRIINVSRIPPKGMEEHIEAKPAEREALVARFGLVDLPKLVARIVLMPGDRQAVQALGEIEAEIVQKCVVTLEPIANRLKLNVEVVFLPKEVEKLPDDISLDDVDDEFEYYSGGKIDIGELVAQHLGVNIDPYPRKAEAELKQTEFGQKPEKSRPFARLGVVIKTKKNKGKTPEKS